MTGAIAGHILIPIAELVDRSARVAHRVISLPRPDQGINRDAVPPEIAGTIPRSGRARGMTRVRIVPECQSFRWSI
jgi:hypothetical protein